MFYTPWGLGCVGLFGDEYHIAHPVLVFSTLLSLSCPPSHELHTFSLSQLYLRRRHPVDLCPFLHCALLALLHCFCLFSSFLFLLFCFRNRSAPLLPTLSWGKIDWAGLAENEKSLLKKKMVYSKGVQNGGKKCSWDECGWGSPVHLTTAERLGWMRS